VAGALYLDEDDRIGGENLERTKRVSVAIGMHMSAKCQREWEWRVWICWRSGRMKHRLRV
jgi:hypothetical protein